MGKENDNKIWTVEDIQYIKENWLFKSDEEISKNLKRTRRAVKAERQALGLLRQQASKKHNYQEVKQLFEDRNYILLSTEYTNTTTPLEYICRKHEEKGILKIALREFLSGKGCRYCGFEKTAKSKMHSDQYYMELCESLGLEYVGRYVNDKHFTVIKYICKKHKDKGIQEKIISSINKRTKCPYCNNHNTENKILEILEKWGFNVITQKRFPDCKDKNTLPFDFYLKDFNILIEYDGEFHYKPIRKGHETEEELIERLHATKHRDQIKTEYCKKNNIPLIRIPYWEKDDLEYFLFDNLVKYGAIEEIKQEAI